MLSCAADLPDRRFTPEMAEDLSSPRPRVLVAEDQASVADAITILLKQNGFEVETVDSPGAAIRALQTHKFDLVLIDMNYHRDTTTGAEGLELLARIQSLDRNLPVIVMTAWGSIEVAVQAMQRGASDFIQKPWDNRWLIEVIERQIRRAEQARRAARLEQLEMDEAVAIQRKLVPQTVQSIPGTEISAVLHTARPIGGDYFDVLKLSDTSLAVCVADAVGKGVPAALLMANLQATVRAVAGPSPAEVCERVNRSLQAINISGNYMSLFYGVLDANGMEFSYCNAGHPSPLLLTNNGNFVALERGGAVLGHFPDWKYEQDTIHLGRGDRMVIYTDGIAEATNARGEQFGLKGIAATLRAHASGEADQIRDQIMNAVKQHCGGPPEDDATLLVIALLGGVRRR
jgi:phosphoserine phosphatase RsbU/P